MTNSASNPLSEARPVSSVTRFADAHVFSVDVEEWYQVGAFENTLQRSDWPSLESRVERQCHHILALLDEAKVKATFFCLGWVAERHPLLISTIHKEGHELACHGMAHERIFRFSREEFRQDVLRAKALLEDASGACIHGYRAPSFSLTADIWWAYEVLEEAGFSYSSSLYPLKTDHYGMPEAPRRPFWPIGEGRILEVPMTVCKRFGRALPASGGGYFRLLPYALGKYMFLKGAAQTGAPGIFYMHPWEVDPEQPYMEAAPWLSRFRHYTGQKAMPDKLKALLGSARWDSLHQTIVEPAFKAIGDA